MICVNDEIYKNDNDNNNFKVHHLFYDTNNFEVYCFCPILLFTRTDNVLKNENIINNTNYLFVGGFQKDKNKGMIKLYRINYGMEYDRTKLEYIQDIDFNNDNNFKGFKEPISSIFQSTKNGDILISCWDGNTYLFHKPNIDDYLKNDKLEEKFFYK